MVTLQIELTDKEWEHLLRERRYEVGEEFSEQDIKEGIEIDLRNKLLEWYPMRLEDVEI